MSTKSNTIFLMCCLVASAISKIPVSLKMGCQQSTTSAVDCSFQFTNVVDEDYYLLKRDTPLEGLRSPFVSVSHDGVSLQYEGYLFYSMPPLKDEFILLKAGESVTATAQINNIFTFSSDGMYNIRYNKPLKVLLKDKMELQSDSENIEEVDLMKVEVSESVDIQLENTDLLSRPVKEEVKEGDEVYSQACNNIFQFVGGNSNARDDTRLVHDMLCDGLLRARNNVRRSPLYRRWFGDFNRRRANVVRSILQKSHDKIAYNRLTYDFTGDECTGSNFAYTCFHSNVVFLCDLYIGHSAFCGSAMYNKERTLAHEWTHAGGNTWDHIYGSAESQQLATDEPDKAVDNADNYSFFYCRR
ncbi:PREDICTED: uncharacterized protein LOC105314252 [Amphimedon queenslandica]|uniref:Lysine-specific metallo-endopeptidase domain-containing protein n=2 Tax=Amphimedon queenslandica TaxID=400682 RepID=A0AAN0IPL7_AMPQE|nr:PREDICTED: uncharacterized protein LOC105314252 [Amphimedon queenslandica]|eukprot:XP_011406615.2 PREDICTED: uncharacterized protein LOC105314252 [Amphimedon queenslandica]